MGSSFADMSKVNCQECNKEVFNQSAVKLDPNDKYSTRFCSEECKEMYTKSEVSIHSEED